MIIIFLFQEMSSNQRMEQKILSGGSSAVLNKVMTPSNDFDSNSLKRRKFFKIIGFKTGRLVKGRYRLDIFARDIATFR